MNQKRDSSPVVNKVDSSSLSIEEQRFGRGPERGAILLFGLVVSLLVLLTTVAAINMTFTMGKEARYKLDHTRALSLAEGTTESAQKTILNQVSNFQPVPLSGTVTLGGGSYPYSVTPIGSPFTLTDSDGFTSSIQHYQISASVNAGEGYATVDRVVDLTMTPIFQFMIFYDDDLEILPGPSMMLGGRVHSNASIYVGSGNTLTVNSEYFRCTGNILRKRKNDNSEATGTVNFKVKGDTSYVPMDNLHDAEFSSWTTYALDTWNGTVHGTAPIPLGPAEWRTARPGKSGFVV